MPTPLSDSDKVLRNDTGKDIVEKLDDIAQALGVGVNADQINYDNTTSGLEATDVQDAIDEVKDITDDLDEKIDDKTSYESTASGSIVTFNDGGDNIPMKSCEVAIVAQQASGTPSPDNDRPITGFSSVDVAVTPKNLFNPQCLIDNGATESGGVYSFANQVITNVLALPLNTSERLTFKYKGRTTTASTNGYMAIIYTDGTMTRDVTSHTADTWYDVTLTSESGKTIRGILLSYYSSRAKTDFTEIQLEIGTTATAYEPFGTTHTIPLGQTIYGGTAELVGGNGTKVWTFYTNTWGNGVDVTDLGNNIRKNFTLPELPDTTRTDIICNVAPYDNAYGTDSCHFYISPSNKRLYVFLPEGTPNDTVIQVAYVLATPTAFTFTGANIPTLSGVNNVYADSGDINALEYFNDKADDIASMVALESGRQVDLVKTLETGQTSLTFTNPQITTDSTIDVYVWNSTLMYSSMTVSEGQVVLTFPTQANDIKVKVRVS